MWKTIYKILVVAIFLGMIVWILSIAPNYKKSETEGKIQWIINNNDVTLKTKKDTYRDENGNFYVALEDIANYFDSEIYYDAQYDQIVTTGYSKIAVIPIDGTTMAVNGRTELTNAPIVKKETTYYIPLKELEAIYEISVDYKEITNTIVVESLERQAKSANTKKKSTVHFRPTIFSKSVEKIGNAEEVTVIEEQEGWTKVRTQNGILGYIQSNQLENEAITRQATQRKTAIEGNISMVWDYFSEYASAPDRTGTSIEGVNVVSPTFAVLEKYGKGALEVNIGSKGQSYMRWAKAGGYQVWPMISNNSMIDTTAEIMRDYETRAVLIENILSLVEQNHWDGVNIDFEYMYMEDKELFNRFLIELAPRLHEKGAVLSVDVTQPDGSENWSLCFDRTTIAKVADYIVFMAYDQNGGNSAKEGTTAGYDWVETNIKKFLEQEEVDANKLILGVPFYTRVWKETNGEIESSVISIKNLENYIPEGVQKTWDENLKQYYVEYEQAGTIYKIWLEEETSIAAKLDLVQTYQLAGASFWTKDREMPEIWTIIKEKLGI